MPRLVRKTVDPFAMVKPVVDNQSKPVDRIAALTEAGVVIGWGATVNVRYTGAKDQLVRIVRYVQPRLTPQEWCSLCMMTGSDYVGGTGDWLDGVQDVIDESFHGSGTFDDSRIGALYRITGDNGGFDDLLPLDDVHFSVLMERWHAKRLSPYDRIRLIVLTLQPYLDIEA